MDEIKLSDDVIEQIKGFHYWNLTKEQESLIDKLITDKELKERYKGFGLCEKCKQPKIYPDYCRPCKSQYFKQNFKNWTSGNHNVDEFIQKAQLKAKNIDQVIEWVEYDKFENVEYLAKGRFGTTFKAVWKDGPWKLNDNYQLERKGETKVALKCLHNSQDITAEFLKEVESNILVYNTGWVVRCFGITKDPKTNDFMMVMVLKDGSLRQYLNNNFISINWEEKLLNLQAELDNDISDNKVSSVIYGQVKEADEIKESSLTVQLPLPSTIEFSGSLKMDFTKLDINPKDEKN
ncbi:kinase-like domain-containing protein [Rhizophagus irregularis DAOM 181602=DAOM 197198]|nr:kinase-like domain-containing protein [Rhizophagus irregularis DAOM 181602=DAOM 197198]